MQSRINGDKGFRPFGNSTVGASYARLGSSANERFGGIAAPVPSTYSTKYYVVPSYSSPGYDTLSHGTGGTGNSYFTIGSAYGTDCGVAGNYDSSSYVSSMCGNNPYSSSPFYGVTYSSSCR